MSKINSVEEIVEEIVDSTVMERLLNIEQTAILTGRATEYFGETIQDTLTRVLTNRDKEIVHQWNKCELKLDGTTQGVINCIESFRDIIAALSDSK